MVLISGTGMDTLPKEKLEPKLLRLTIGLYDFNTKDAGWGENAYEHPILIPAGSRIRFPNGFESTFSEDVLNSQYSDLGLLYKKPIAPSKIPVKETPWGEPIDSVPIEDIAIIEYSRVRRDGKPIYTITRPLRKQEIEETKTKYEERIAAANKLMDDGLDGFIESSEDPKWYKERAKYALEGFRETVQGAIWNAQRATLGVCNFNDTMLEGVLDAMQRQFDVFTSMEPHRGWTPGYTTSCGGANTPTQAVGHLPKRMYILASYLTNAKTRRKYQRVSSKLHSRNKF